MPTPYRGFVVIACSPHAKMTRNDGPSTAEPEQNHGFHRALERMDADEFDDILREKRGEQ